MPHGPERSETGTLQSVASELGSSFRTDLLHRVQVKHRGDCKSETSPVATVRLTFIPPTMCLFGLIFPLQMFFFPPPDVLTPSTLTLTLGVHAEDKRPGHQRLASHPPTAPAAAHRQPPSLCTAASPRFFARGLGFWPRESRFSCLGCRGLAQATFTLS